MKGMQELLRRRNTPRSSLPCRISRKTCGLFMSRSGSAGKLSALLPSKAGCLPVLLKTSISFLTSLAVGNLLTLPCLTSLASPTKRVIIGDHQRAICGTSTMQISHRCLQSPLFRDFHMQCTKYKFALIRVECSISRVDSSCRARARAWKQRSPTRSCGSPVFHHEVEWHARRHSNNAQTCAI